MKLHDETHFSVLTERHDTAANSSAVVLWLICQSVGLSLNANDSPSCYLARKCWKQWFDGRSVTLIVVLQFCCFMMDVFTDLNREVWL